MNKVKVMTVFGTRPEAIKMAPLVLKLKKDDRFEEITVVSAQHREMLDQVLDIFKIKPDYDFNIMHKNQTLEDITSKVMLDMAKVIKKEQPDIVLVHGDTTTSFAAGKVLLSKDIEAAVYALVRMPATYGEIGRASCRERV